MIAALLAAAFVATSVLGSDVAAQTTRAQWWGPTAMTEGWHVRVPVAVNNSGSYALNNVTAGYDISVGDLLTAAGWPARAGNASQPASFQLDEQSVRVVEYRSLGTGSPFDGVILGPVPSKAHLGPYSTRRAYDNATQPDIHVTWVMPGETKSNSTRYFYVYLDSAANGPKSAPEPDARDAYLDAAYWIGRGTTLYGKAKSLVLLGLEDNTIAEIQVYENGKAKPLVLSRNQGAGNGVALTKGEQVTLPIGDSATLVRVKSNFPVVAAGTPTINTVVTGPLASADGGVLGKNFVLPSGPPGYTVYRPIGTSVVTIDGFGQRALSPGTPMWVFRTDGLAGPITLQATDPVMVLAWPNMESAPPLVTPEGTPLGSTLVGRPYGGLLFISAGRNRPTPAEPPCTTFLLELYPGKTTLYTPDRHAYWRGLNVLTTDVLYPVVAGKISPRAGELSDKATTFQTAPDQGCPLMFYSTGSATSSEPDGTSRIGGFGGGEDAAPTGPIGLVNATDGTVSWPVSLVAHHNGTLVTLVKPTGIETRGLDAGGVMDVAATPDAPVKVHASKPIFALHAEGGGFFPGIDESLRIEQIGPADFRGYLIDLKSADGRGSPMVAVGAPGKPTTYRLLVRNLARDVTGAPAPDQVQLSTDAVPFGWYANLSDSTVSLAGGAEKVVTLTVTPPPDADEGSRLALSIHATSLGNPNLRVSLPTVTILRVAYGVDLWFDREGGPKQDTFTMDPGASKDVEVVVKNLATVRDSFVVTATALSPDWSVGIEDLPGSLTEVELEPGATAKLTLHVHAPGGGASQSVLQVGAVSVADAAVGAQIVAALRTRANVEIALSVDHKVVEALPGALATFNFTLHNRGNDSISARWNVQAHLPEGWSPILTKVGPYNLTEVSGIPAQSKLNISLLVPVAANATRGDLQTIGLALETIPQFAGDTVKSESESVRVLVAAHHDLALSGAKPLVDVDENGTARATIRLENRGNGGENLSLYPDELPANTSVLTPPILDLAIGENKTLSATLAISSQMPPGDYPVKMRIVSDDGAPTFWDFSLRLPEVARVSIASESPTVSVAGQSYVARVTLQNEGNVPLELPPRIAAPEGWSLAWGAQSGTLTPGQSISTTLTVSAPRTATPGDAVLAPEADWATGPGLPWTLRTVELKANSTVESRFVRVLLSNDGTGDAVDVDVSVFQAGRRVDTFVVPRIPPGGTANATLALPASGGGLVELKIDEGAHFGEPLVQPLDVQTKDAPGAGALAALAVAFAVAVLVGRRKG